jgi:ubiquinone/menaquinone biosynthesis C-methylase UbiE
VTALRAQWTKVLDRQHRYPTGLIGQHIGERMVWQHAPETAWTIKLLDLQPADRVLELGFGAGQGLALAARHTYRGHITGIDLSATMIRVATRRNRGALRAGRMTLARGDVGALPVGAAQFNKIFSIHTLYFWPDPLQVFGDLLQILNPHGTIVVTLATGQRLATGEVTHWPLHSQAAALVTQLAQRGIDAALQHGPDSRQYNNVAIVLRR